jgi:hypothetical protein
VEARSLGCGRKYAAAAAHIDERSASNACPMQNFQGLWASRPGEIAEADVMNPGQIGLING